MRRNLALLFFCLSMSFPVVSQNVSIWPASATPASVDSNDGNPVEVGVNFKSSVPGLISGLRFYKASTNTGTHIGHLWTSTGTLLASATFTGETASGWQQVAFSSPIEITPNTTYVVSYFAPVGHYSDDLNYFATSGVNSPPLQALENTVSAPNGVYLYSPSGGFPSYSYAATNYWVDVVFTPIPANSPWFTIWQPSATPGVVDFEDGHSVELGVGFRADADGYVEGIRFYKASANTGTHQGNLWSSTGTLLGSATFGNETASGWQQVLFSNPVHISANTTYIASYFAPEGHYSGNTEFFATSGVDTPPLHALQDSTEGANGIYIYSETSAFPNATYNAANYWVDVIYSTLQVQTPTVSPAAGTYSTAQSVTISDTTSGATIYYTTDGSTPTTSSSVYSGPITVSSTETVKAIATATGYLQSLVETAVYTITPPAATPTVSPAAGTYSTAQSVTISDTTSGATIYYTTDGSTPTVSSNVYSGPITVSSTEILKAIAIAPGYSQSVVASAVYTITPPAAAPAFSPAAGTYSTAQSVTISDTTSGATIYYTTDGSMPTTSSSVYSGPITVSSTEILIAIATAPGYSQSVVATATLTITPVSQAVATPTFNPVPGTYINAQTVTISDSTSGSTIYYTTDGTTPTVSSHVYSGPITVSSTETVKAIATATGYSQSVVASAHYFVSAVLPIRGPVGTTITINGIGFGGTRQDNSVTIGGVQAYVLSWSDTQITALITTSFGFGVQSVAVSVGTLSAPGATFTVTPAIDLVTPGSGIPGSVVNIYGTSFGTYVPGSSTVTCGAVPANIVNWSDYEIDVTVPSLSSSSRAISAPIVVTAYDAAYGLPIASNSAAFTESSGPVITGLSPQYGPAGTNVTISGVNFGNSPQYSTVTFNGISSAPTSWSIENIGVPVPAGATTGPVVVAAYGMESNGLAFTVTDGIAGILPTSGVPGTTVTISGTGFGSSQGNSVVTFNGVRAAPSSWSASSIVVVVPSGATTGNVAVLVNGVSATGPVFTVLPFIANLSPVAGAVGTVVTVSGSNFGAVQGNSKIYFGQAAGTPTRWSQNQIVVRVPAGATTAPITVNVAGQSSNSIQFTVGNTNVSSISGVVTSTNETTISGASLQALQSNFSMGVATSAANGTYTIPNLAGGTYDLLVSASGFGSSIIPGLVVQPSGTVTANVQLGPAGAIVGTITQSDGITPIASANVTVTEGGDTVASAATDATGAYSIANLGAATYDLQASASGFEAQARTGVSITANQNTAANFSLSGRSTISYTYDELGRLVGVVDSVKGSAGYAYDAVGNILNITRTNPGHLSLLDFSPKSGPIGTVITVTGTGFSANPQQDSVSFTGGTSSQGISAAGGQIVVAIPTGASTGPITVTTPAGTVTSSGAFTVTPSQAPSIKSFDPAIANIGSTIAITGTGFDASENDRIAFNNATGAVTSAGPTIISAVVPANGSSGPISITTPFGSAKSSTDFFVVPESYSAGQIEFTGRISSGGSYSATINVGGDIGLILFDATAGQQINLSASGSTFTAATVSILNPGGSTLESSTIGIGATNLDSISAPTSGTYSIFIASNGGSGSITLTLNEGTSGGSGSTIPTQVGFITPGQIVNIPFSGLAGQFVYVQIWPGNLTGNCDISPASFDVSIVNPDGSILNTGTASCGWLNVGPSPLPATGNYRLIFVPQKSVTGYVNLSISLFNQQTGVLIPGTTVPFAISVPGQQIQLTFTGTAGQLVDVLFPTLNDQYGESVSILAPDGSLLLSGDVTGGNNQSVGPALLPSTGTYTVVIAARYIYAVSGSISLALFSNQAGTITSGSSVPINISSAGQATRLTFSAGATQSAVVQMSNTSFLRNNSAEFSISSPDGSTLATRVGGVGPYWDQGHSTASLNSGPLPVNGTYTVTISAVNGNTGTADISLALVDNLAGAITPGVPTPIAISATGQQTLLSFSGTAGQSITLGVANSTFGYGALGLNLVGPDGSIVGHSDYPGNSFYMTHFSLTTTGTYTLEIGPTITTGSADLTLWLFNDQVATISAGSTVPVSLSYPGQEALLTFSGTAGQFATLQLSGTNFPNCSVMGGWILNPDGSQLGGFGTGIGGSCGDGRSGPFAMIGPLPTTGAYTILLVDYNEDVGSTNITLSLQ